MSAVVGIHVPNILILTFLDVTHVPHAASIKKRDIYDSASGAKFR